MDIFYDIVANPEFNQEELNREKSVINREMHLIKDRPQKYLSQEFWQTAYTVHPYRNPIIGHEDIFDSLTPEDLRQYYSRFYIPDNMILVIVGDIDSQKVKQKIKSMF